MEWVFCNGPLSTRRFPFSGSRFCPWSARKRARHSKGKPLQPRAGQQQKQQGKRPKENAPDHPRTRIAALAFGKGDGKSSRTAPKST
jgi:hypothetical protein